jgi:hypothetical protein
MGRFPTQIGGLTKKSHLLMNIIWIWQRVVRAHFTKNTSTISVFQHIERVKDVSRLTLTRSSGFWFWWTLVAMQPEFEDRVVPQHKKVPLVWAACFLLFVFWSQFISD